MGTVCWLLAPTLPFDFSNKAKNWGQREMVHSYPNQTLVSAFQAM